jgi:hypothetical protein
VALDLDLAAIFYKVQKKEILARHRSFAPQKVFCGACLPGAPKKCHFSVAHGFVRHKIQIFVA